MIFRTAGKKEAHKAPGDATKLWLGLDHHPTNHKINKIYQLSGDSTRPISFTWPLKGGKGIEVQTNISVCKYLIMSCCLVKEMRWLNCAFGFVI